MKCYLGVDPGKGGVDSIGYAIVTDDATLIEMGQLTFPQFVMALETMAKKYEFIGCVYETYRVFRKKAKAHIGSKVETVQSIGVLKSWALRNNIPVAEQNPDILSIAERHFQIKLPEDHTISHQFSALLHVKEWLYRKGIGKSALELELEAGR